MADEVTRLTYEGPPAFVGLLAQIFREEGLSVHYDPPLETRDASGAIAIATVILAVTGPIVPAIWERVKRFRDGSRSRVAIRGSSELEQTIEERLATVDRLLEQGTISEEEHAEQRARLLNEL